MTATDELRRMLDERGVEYRIRDGKDGFRRLTYWEGTASNGYPFYARYEQEHYAEGDMTILEINMHKYQLTPEQAIEATLGSAELRKERDALDRLTDVLNATNDGLLAENAKLRELLQRTWDAFHDAPAREFFYVKNKLRELGIEVDA